MTGFHQTRFDITPVDAGTDSSDPGKRGRRLAGRPKYRGHRRTREIKGGASVCPGRDLYAFTLRRRREINAVHSILSGYIFLVLKEEVLSD